MKVLLTYLKKVFYPTLRIILGVLIISSGVLKFLYLGSFQESIKSFDILYLLNPIIFSYIIPSVEIILGLMFLFSFRLKVTSTITLMLLSLFTSVLLAQLDSNKQISCQCFGLLSDGAITWTTILRNIALIAGTLFIYANDGRPAIRAQFYEAIILSAVFLLISQTFALSLQNRILKDRLSILVSGFDLKAGESIGAVTAVTSKVVINVWRGALKTFDINDVISTINNGN